MSQEMLSARIDRESKVAFTDICESLGLSTSQAIKLFAKAVINHGGIPFELRVRQPNKMTVAAMEELNEGRGHKAESVDSLVAELTDGKVNHV